MSKILNLYEKYIWNNPIAKPIHTLLGTNHLPSKVIDTSKKVIDITGKFLSFDWVIYLIFAAAIVLLIIIFK